MAETDAKDGPAGDNRASPTHITSPALRYEAKRALLWVTIVGLAILAIYISQALLVIFGALVFASMLDGGARLLGRVLPIGRGWRLALVLLLAIGFIVWLVQFAGNQIAYEAAELPQIVTEQANRFFAWLDQKGFDIGLADVQGVAGQLMSGVGTLTKAIGGIFGAMTTLFLIAIIGIYIALEPRLYERGIAWMLPPERRGNFYVTVNRMSFSMRRLMGGRLLGMAFEGVFTWVMLAVYGVPMAALLAILTGLLAFIPNVGAIVSGILMILVGFSGGLEMGFYTIFVYFLVQNIDGYIVVPLIARKTVDLAPALVLAAQLVMGVLFGVLGLFLADPLLAMIKVALERRAEQNEQDGSQPEAEANGP
ncbi:MAG: AI-2E family transporter [Porphyrobacter sp.]|nr:AI-2E family transporter [Porphyrobacter sp.]